MLKEPIFVENSKVPGMLSWVVRIWAITLFPFVFCRGLIGEVTRRHETIHHKQYIETLVIGFLLIYLIDWIHGLIKYRNGAYAYKRIRFEQEAFEYGYEDYFFSGNYCFIEWPEKIPSFITDNYLLIEIEMNLQIRELQVTAV